MLFNKTPNDQAGLRKSAQPLSFTLGSKVDRSAMANTSMKISHFTRILLAAATLITVSVSSSADTLYGRVVGVSDGDTVTVLDSAHRQYKIRLMGIDAPEKKQAFGNRSKQSLSGLVFNRHVQVEYNKKDKYGRTVGKIIVNGMDANLEQVRSGLAWHYKQYQREHSTTRNQSFMIDLA